MQDPNSFCRQGKEELGEMEEEGSEMRRDGIGREGQEKGCCWTSLTT
jgi:hypothetical protein